MTIPSKVRAYQAPGPVAQAFIASRAAVCGIMGPLGSGKTSAAFVKHLVAAGAQQPSTRDGWRKYKLLTVRDNLREVWKTTIPSWRAWVPETMGEWVGGKDTPATHTLRFALPDGSKLLFVHEFAGIGDMNVESFFDGYEPTAVHLNAATLLPREVLFFARGRVGRYPTMDEGGPSWSGVTMDYNAPDTDHWMYELMTAAPDPALAFFRQPSGFAADAENVRNLPAGYYTRQAAGQPEWYVTRMLRNEFGPSRAGRPVYPEFADRVHVLDAEPVPDPALALSIGIDQGRNPAAVICQRSGLGRRTVLDELVMAGVGVRSFARALMQLLGERYPAWAARPLDDLGRPSILVWADPAAANPTELDDTATFLSIFAAETKLRAAPARVPGNSPTLRHEAVRRELTTLLDDGRPQLLLSPRCPILRRGFNSGYRFRKLRVSGVERYADEVEKDQYSHPHDALQYEVLGDGDYAAVLGRERSRDRTPRQVRVADDLGDAEFASGGRW